MATVAQWFGEKSNTKARKHLDKWVTGRRNGGEPEGVRGLLTRLQDKHGFPFQDHTALWKFVKREHGAIGSPAPAVEEHHRSAGDLKKIESGSDFFVTSAVSNCYANPKFLKAIKHWQREHDAKIIVNGVRYKNPTRLGEEIADEWYDPTLAPYMLNQEIRPHPLLSILPTKIQATTANPLPPRLAALTQNRHAIFGHPQLAMRTVPTLNGEAKVMWSTGAITEPHYSDTLAGTMGEFHHSLAGVIVQVRGDELTMREVTWDGEAFIDLDRHYSETGSRAAPPALALVMGDIHVRHTSDVVMEATFGTSPGQCGLYPLMKHKTVVLHDLPDFGSVNPHEMNNHLSRAAKASKGRTNVQDEVDDIANWLNALPTGPEVVVVRSNHDEFLTRWLQAGERNVDPENKRFYHWLSLRMLDEHEATGRFPITLATALEPSVRKGIRFLDFDESFRLGGIELGQHGHLGPNGSRGMIKNYALLAVRTVIGHSHSPGIWQGCYQGGQSGVERHGYNVGPSGWWTAHVSVLANGRRQMHLITRSGRYRG